LNVGFECGTIEREINVVRFDTGHFHLDVKGIVVFTDIGHEFTGTERTEWILVFWGLQTWTALKGFDSAAETGYENRDS